MGQKITKKTTETNDSAEAAALISKQVTTAKNYLALVQEPPSVYEGGTLTGALNVHYNQTEGDAGLIELLVNAFVLDTRFFLIVTEAASIALEVLESQEGGEG